ncbi:MAG: hypothetical protein MK236_03560 [Pedosphaera sp.]|nr:hypothetical protein [Pedosphaera sp.]
MKTMCQFLCFALLLASGLEAAEVTATPKLSMSNLSGVPTPLEEYGLSIGDITVTRVINPLGQLKQGSPIMLARRLQTITNPWAELTPGTTLIVGGKKAVIRQIQPDTAPQDRGSNLKLIVTAEEIAGTTMTLEWRQELHNLNSPETVEARKQTVTHVKENLRVGSHLILNNDRVVVTERTITYAPDSTSDRDMELTIKYQSLSSGEGELTGKPSTSEVVTDSAWNFRKKDNTALENDTAQLITWTLKNRDGDDDNIPDVTVLHRSRGSITQLQLTEQRLVTAMAKFEQDRHAHTHIFKWAQETDDKGRFLWHMEPGVDDYIEVFRINDTNIDFKVTPEALLAANREASAKLQGKNNNKGDEKNGDIDTRALTPGNVDAESLEQQIKILKKIMEGDASKIIKLDAKRQAVIYLARYYEHSAVSHQALATEYLARAEIQLQRARNLERHAWANSQKLSLIRAELVQRKETLPAKDKPAPGQAEDTIVERQSITKLDREIAEFKVNLPTDSSPSIRIQHAIVLRKLSKQKALALKYRKDALDLRTKARKLQTKIFEDFSESLKFWTEYIHRTEGLSRDERLSESGVGGNVPPPEPDIPEILLRQAWIYRQMGRPELALSTYYSVLTAATQQKVDNLTRFSRIVLVARSQIANTYYEDADPLELKDYISANDLYERLLKSNQEEMNTDSIELKLLRSLFKADENSRIKLRKLKLKRIKLQKMTSKKPVDGEVVVNPFTSDTELKQIQVEIKKLIENRQGYWKLMEKHATAFIQRTAESGTIISHHHTGEVRYYQIMANSALGNHQHVQQGMEVLLENESTPNDQRQAWTATRVRVVIDIANRLFSRGKELQEDPAQHKLKVTVPTQGGGQRELSVWRQCLEAAVVYYKWALEHDQSYRDQILIRQQIGFCYHRLGFDNDDNDLSSAEQDTLVAAARDHYDFILRLCDMHPSDVNNNPTIRVIRDLTRIRLQNLNLEIKRKEKTRTPQNSPT